MSKIYFKVLKTNKLSKITIITLFLLNNLEKKKKDICDVQSCNKNKCS